MSPSTPVQPGQIVLAVDGGGTKTACCIARILDANQWEVLGNGQAGPSNPRAVGMDIATEAILLAVKSARKGLEAKDIACDHALFSIAGTLDSTVRSALTQKLRVRRLATNLAVVPDLYPLLDCSSDQPSFGLIAGTGSVGIGRNGNGQLAIAGGWGHILGDDGSGFAIGREGLRYTLQALETTGKPFGLAAVICEQWGVSTAYEMKTHLASFSDLKSEVAQLSKIVVDQAQKSDMTAVGILLKSADDLANLVQQLRVRLDVPEKQISVRVSGGLFQHDGFFLDVLKQSLGGGEIDPTVHVLTEPLNCVLEMLVSGFQPEQYELLP